MPDGWTNFCCRAGGSNLNAGTTDGANTEEPVSAAHTYSGGSYTSPTFTVASGDPASDGVQVGQFAALNDGGATAIYLARITAVSSTTITLSTTYDSASIPASGTYELRVGGAWQGPNGAETFPFGTLDNNLRKEADGSTHRPFVNLKNDQTYSITTQLNVGNIQGYGTTYGDGEKALIQGPATGASFYLCNFGSCFALDLILDRNGDSGTTGGAFAGSAGLFRVTCRNMMGPGFYMYSYNFAVECEAYNNNTYGFWDVNSSWPNSFTRCISRGNTSYGFFLKSTQAVVSQCVAAENNYGFYVNSKVCFLSGCTAYNNVNDGFRFAGGSSNAPALFESNFSAANGGYGLFIGTLYGGRNDVNILMNNRYGVGAEANTLGDEGGFIGHNVIKYDNATPLPSGTVGMNDPANGDFRIVAESLQQAGRGGYTQEEPGQSGMVGFPDIGAGQSYIAGGGLIKTGFNGGFNS